MELIYGKKILRTVVLVATCGILILSVLIISKAHNNIYSFDEWKSETNEAICSVMYDRQLSFNKGTLNLYEILESVLPGQRIEEVMCIDNGRIFFVCSEGENTWLIASVNTNGEEYTEHFQMTVNDKNNYHKLSEYSNLYEYDGGLCDGRLIMLKDGDNIAEYNLQTNEVSISDSLPEREISWTIADDNEVIFYHSTSNEIRTVTLESMSKLNSYAEKLFAISGRKIWDSSSPVSKFFSCIKIVGKDIYIVGQVLNWHGESTAVLFKYDFNNGTVKYVTSSKVGDRVSTNYDFCIVN